MIVPWAVQPWVTMALAMVARGGPRHVRLAVCHRHHGSTPFTDIGPRVMITMVERFLSLHMRQLQHSASGHHLLLRFQR
jgi:hypothetical protein